jgi:uncharacterized protein HemX
MRAKARHCAWILAAVLGLGTGPAALSQDQNRDQAHDQASNQDYSKNKNYQQGQRDGKDDLAHNRDHSKKRHFKKDDDQKAYESGYQQSRHDNQSDSPDRH